METKNQVYTKKNKQSGQRWARRRGKEENSKPARKNPNPFPSLPSYSTPHTSVSMLIPPDMNTMRTHKTRKSPDPPSNERYLILLHTSAKGSVEKEFEIGNSDTRRIVRGLYPRIKC